MSQTAFVCSSEPVDDVPPLTGQEESGGASDYLLAGLVCIIICIGAIPFNSAVLHWFLLPISVCGVIMGSDAVRWWRGRLDVFDAKATIGVLGFHFFFFAPLLYVVTGAEMRWVRNPDDWRPWIGGVAAVHVVALVVYKLVQRWASRGYKPRRTVWIAVPGRTGPILGLAIVMSTVAFLYLLVRMGGLHGLAVARTEESTAMHKMGIPRIISMSLPVLCFLAFTICYRRRPWRRSGLGISLIVLGVLGMLQLLVAGYGTSRGEVTTAGFWILAGIHFCWRPLRPRTLVWMFIPFIAFMWMYSFYKALGLRAFDYVRRGETVEDLSHRSGRPFLGILVGDLARVDIHAQVFWIQTTDPSSYTKKFGQTYLMAPVPMIPFWLWRDKPLLPEKVVAGTELLWGRDYLDVDRRLYDTHAYGLTGEAMLNFGVLSVPFAYAVLGFLVGRFRRWVRSVPVGDLRFLLIPFVVHFLFNMLLWDMDNYIAHSIIRAGFSLPVLWLAVGRVPIAETTDSRPFDPSVRTWQ